MYFSCFSGRPLFRYNFERFFDGKNILIKGSNSSNSNSSAVKGTRVCLMSSPKLIFLSNFFRVFGFQTFLISFVSFIAVSPSRNNCLTRLFTSPSSRSTYITHKRNPEVHWERWRVGRLEWNKSLRKDLSRRCVGLNMFSAFLFVN